MQYNLNINNAITNNNHTNEHLAFNVVLRYYFFAKSTHHKYRQFFCFALLLKKTEKSVLLDYLLFDSLNPVPGIAYTFTSNKQSMERSEGNKKV